MSANGGTGISPHLLQVIAAQLSGASGASNGALLPRSTSELSANASDLTARPVITLKEGQTLIIVQNYTRGDHMEDGGSTGERSEGESGDVPSAKGMLWDQAGRPFQVMGSGLNSSGMTLLVQSKAESGSPGQNGCQNGSPSDQAHSNGDAPAPCPICGDKVSGYHYGIYSCESCKGFFKRTVQNGKSFTCRHRGQCTITIANRKKCPACRFVKCRLAGMRLEAIRPDRTRGGRSSYEGCYARAPTSDTDRVIQPTASSQSLPVKHSANGNAATPRPPKRMSHSSSSDRFISVPRPDKPSSPGHAAAALPQTLVDLLAAEALMENDEDEELEARLSLQSGDPFKSLFHLIDHCLYKIVRWARNQPDFSRVQTDDQILLLQNCWSEMLFINCCWRSIKMENAIHVGKNNTITMELAKKMDLEKVTVRLIDYTNFLRSFQVDMYEIVALKTLLLFSPDVENLSNSDAVRSYQEQLLEILMMYTNERYPNIPNKFGHLLMKQAELSRTCYLAKEQLIPYERSGKIPAQSLLHELLKGDLPLH